ncbi:MAG: DegT/DnrJ/EryC1/StrS family aminotransferase [Alicyclobacillus sp.]|nr:DegT/DnrJ/EryC1/StrS family aminotransferase [Alicyclobacillus sp.]
MAAVQGVLRSGQFIMGPNVKAFEQEVAQYLGVKHAIGVNSGTDALVIALRALGIGPGDEVITTPFTFFATAEAISLVGATPVFVDIDPDTLNIDPNLIEDAITERTKAILPVHLFGKPCEMDVIMDIAERRGLKVIEDCAQSFGAEFEGKKVGTIGYAGCFSFFPSKNLGGCGDGGLIATNDDQFAQISRMLRAHGGRNKYYNEMIGYNSRLDEIQAAILRVKLPRVDGWNELRWRVARRYRELLSGVEGIRLILESHRAKDVYHQFTIRILDGTREDVHRRLTGAGIGAMIYYPTPVHRLPAYDLKPGTCPLAEQAAHEVLSLPIWPTLSTGIQEEVARCICRRT